MLCAPSLPPAGVNDTEHDAVPSSVQEAGTMDPFCASVHVTVPAAGTRSPESTLLTVAVQVVPTFTGSGLAVQLVATVVGLKVTITSAPPVATPKTGLSAPASTKLEPAPPPPPPPRA